MFQISGLSFEPPEQYSMEEMSFGLRGAPKANGAPSLLVESKKARAGAVLEELAGETLAQLLHSLPGLTGMTRAEFPFADGGKGVMFAYNVLTSAGQLRQYVVLRLSGDRLVSLTATLPASDLDDAVAASLVKSIASVRPS